MRFRNPPRIRLATLLIAAPIAAMLLGFFWRTYLLPRHLELQTKEILDRWRLSNPELLPNATILVRASVVQTQFEGEVLNARLQIDHVYYGPVELAGAGFNIKAPLKRPEGSQSAPLVFPPPFLSENGIWALAANDGKLTPTQCRTLGVAFPQRCSVTRSYRQAEAIADAVERVAAAEYQERVNTLQALAQTDASHVACWAIRALGNGRAEDTRSFLEQLARDQHTPIAAQIEADAALLNLEGKTWHTGGTSTLNGGWQHSPTRVQMFERWADSRLTPDEASRVLRRLNHIALHADSIGVIHEQLVRIVRTAEGNQDLSPEIQTEFVDLLRYEEQ